MNPLAQRGLDEALGFAVGAGSVWTGEEVAPAAAVDMTAETIAAVGAAVVGHEALDVDSELGEVSQGGVEEVAGRSLRLVGQDLGKGQAGVVVTGNMHAFPADAATMARSGRLVAVARAGDAAQGFDVQTQQGRGEDTRSAPPPAEDRGGAAAPVRGGAGCG